MLSFLKKMKPTIQTTFGSTGFTGMTSGIIFTINMAFHPPYSETADGTLPALFAGAVTVFAFVALAKQNYAHTAYQSEDFYQTYKELEEKAETDSLCKTLTHSAVKDRTNNLLVALFNKGPAHSGAFIMDQITSNEFKEQKRGLQLIYNEITSADRNQLMPGKIAFLLLVQLPATMFMAAVAFCDLFQIPNLLQFANDPDKFNFSMSVLNTGLNSTNPAATMTYTEYYFDSTNPTHLASIVLAILGIGNAVMAAKRTCQSMNTDYGDSVQFGQLRQTVFGALKEQGGVKEAALLSEVKMIK